LSPEQFDLFLLCAIGICALGAVMNLAMIKRRGTSAILLSLAFLFLGVTMELYRSMQSKVLTGIGSLAVVALLLADAAFRQSNPRSKR